MRLLTRSDFDGLASAVLLKEAGIIHERKFVHPKDIQEGIIEVTENDVLANIPFVEGCGLWFDHHSSESERLALDGRYKGYSCEAPSAARVIYDYYGGKAKFGHLDELMAAVDKADTGRFTSEEVLNPQGWALLSFIMDPRTGLGRFRDYRISNYQLMDQMIEYCGTRAIADILDMPDVQERVKRYFEQNTLYENMIKDNTRVDGNIIVTDLRGADVIYSGNRFMIYCLYPEQNISIWIINCTNKQNCVFAVGHSIIKRSSRTNVGSLMLKYGGGGHRVVGTCQVPYDDAEKVLADLIATMRQDG
jgi:nanoRNase/pAp phosphatase (c-di-AMP/oligoRNAs hydrolase)